MDSWVSNLRNSSYNRNALSSTSPTESHSGSSSSKTRDRYLYPDDNTASYLNLAKKTVLTANSMVNTLDKSVKESHEVISKRHAMNQNLEDLITLVMQENESYKLEIYRLRDEILSMHDMLRQKESEIILASEEKSLVTEAELTRVLGEHAEIVRQCKIYQQQTIEAQKYSAQLEQHMRECMDAAFQFKQTIASLQAETTSLKAKFDEVRKNNRVLELAYEEVAQYRRERIVREIAFPTNYDAEISKLRTELFTSNEKIKELENENSLLKAERQAQQDVIAAKKLEIQTIEEEKTKALDKAASQLIALEKAKQEAEKAKQEAEKAKQDLEVKLKTAGSNVKKEVVPPPPMPEKHPIALKAERRASFSIQQEEMIKDQPVIKSSVLTVNTGEPILKSKPADISPKSQDLSKAKVDVKPSTTPPAASQPNNSTKASDDSKKEVDLLNYSIDDILQSYF